MERSFRRALGGWSVLLAVSISLTVNAAVVRADREPRLAIGLYMQTRAQWTQDGIPLDESAKDRIDFSVHRAYVYLKGGLSPQFTYLTHLSANRVGQFGKDAAGIGVGTGFAVRDAWIRWRLDEAVQIQIGRMYVPFTRAIGTESTSKQIGLDIAQYQLGGMIPGRIAGRDTGLVVWGNLRGGTFQYRLGMMDGADTGPEGGLRTAGRIVWNLGVPDTGWFTVPARLSGEPLLSIGIGFDRLPRFDGAGADHLGVTADIHFVRTVASGLVAMGEGAVARIDQGGTRYTGTYFYGVAGLYSRHLLDGGFLPYVRYEGFAVDADVTDPPIEASQLSAGVNLYPSTRGHQFKVVLDGTRVVPREGDPFLRVTTQFQLVY